MVKADRRAVSGGGVARHDNLQRSRTLAVERTVDTRKEEGRMIFEYQQMLKEMGLEESAAFKKKKEAYQLKLQKEKDALNPRQAKKRKQRQRDEAEEVLKKEEQNETTPGSDDEEQEKDEEDDLAKSNPYYKAQKEVLRKQKEKEALRKKWAQEVCYSSH